MERIFAVYAKVDLKDKPDWLVRFREKYDQPYEFHITLKQPCYIKEDEIPQLEAKLSNFFNSRKSKEIPLDFKECYVNKGCVMLKSNSARIIELQKSLVKHLSVYNKYQKPEKEEYEKNFQAHITIGRHLTPQVLRKAEVELPKEINISGRVGMVFLALVDEVSAKKVSDPANQVIFGI